MILSSAAWGTPLSALWKIGDGVLEQVYVAVHYYLVHVDHCSMATLIHSAAYISFFRLPIFVCNTFVLVMLT